MKARLFSFSFIFLLLVCKPTFANNLVFIAHKSTMLKNLSTKYLKRVYTGYPVVKEVSLKPTMLPMSYTETQSFVKDYLNMSLFEFDQYWLTKELSGQGITPKSFYNPTKLINFIKKHKGYIGYIDKKYVTNDKLKVYVVKP